MYVLIASVVWFVILAVWNWASHNVLPWVWACLSSTFQGSELARMPLDLTAKSLKTHASEGKSLDVCSQKSTRWIWDPFLSVLETQYKLPKRSSNLKWTQLLPTKNDWRSVIPTPPRLLLRTPHCCKSHDLGEGVTNEPMDIVVRRESVPASGIIVMIYDEILECKKIGNHLLKWIWGSSTSLRTFTTITHIHLTGIPEKRILKWR